MRLPRHLTIKNGYLHTKGQDFVALMRRGETLTDITAAMERPSWQK